MISTWHWDLMRTYQDQQHLSTLTFHANTHYWRYQATTMSEIWFHFSVISTPQCNRLLGIVCYLLPPPAFYEMFVVLCLHDYGRHKNCPRNYDFIFYSHSHVWTVTGHILVKIIWHLLITKHCLEPEDSLLLLFAVVSWCWVLECWPEWRVCEEWDRSRALDWGWGWDTGPAVELMMEVRRGETDHWSSLLLTWNMETMVGCNEISDVKNN